MANVKKLKHLRRLIKNIPKKNIDWRSFVDTWDSNDWTKCILCPAGWIATDPFLTKGRIWIEEDEDGEATLESKDNGGIHVMLCRIFDLYDFECDRLFFPSSYSDEPKRHKAEFLAVLDDIIEDNED